MSLLIVDFLSKFAHHSITLTKVGFRTFMCIFIDFVSSSLSLSESPFSF